MATPASEEVCKPRIGIPYRTEKEEVTSFRRPYDLYPSAIRQAGGEPLEISLLLPPAQILTVARSLDAFVLPGSPADVDPARYGAPRHTKCAPADAARERTDFALLEHAFAERKPVLAICYGNQSLNVFLGGSLIQDIASELHTSIGHEWVGRKEGTPEPFHSATLETDSRLFGLAGMSEVRVNSSHHQSILEPGRNLRVVARAPDGVIEGVEWAGDANQVIGVQWHPERMVETDALARSLFEALVVAANHVPARARGSGLK
jgi:putative glutamine amidotransferase